MNETDEAEIEKIAGWLRDARDVVVLTGAGISTESGIPDFRGPNGVWTKDPAAEKTATLAVLHGRPRGPPARVAEPAEQRVLAGRAERRAPALAELERKGALHILVTQNVDGLHHAAGQSPDIVGRDPRHRARGEVHGVRLARPDGRDARTGARRRGRPGVPATAAGS